MSSPQRFVTSSPPRPRSKSRFTYRQLALLGQSSTACPLRCIALIDYDAFYAQCESVRLGLAEDQPLAVQQWQGLIAINYPARAFDLSRHVTAHEARQKCPHIVLQHVATWREGDDKWAYRDDAARHIQTDKVSLDPYRLESRKSLALVKEVLPPSPVQRVEKASIDEVFLDLSAQIHGILLDRYPELRVAPYDDASEPLPLPPHTALDWQADALVDLDEDQREDDDPDWDDVVMNIGSEIVRGVRQAIRERLKYTCSAGIARNKMMAKLGAGYRKPNQQTIVRNRAVQHFLAGFKFTQIRSLGGKLGDQVVEAFNTDTVADLLKIGLDALRSRFGDETGAWIYGVIRGDDRSEVVSRTAIKSMLSAKSFRPSVNGFEQAAKWLNIFAADIYGRLADEGVLEQRRRRPRTLTLHHRAGGTSQTRSKQLPIPVGKKPIDADTLFALAKTLMGQFVVEGRAWPCSNLSLSVGGFEEGVRGNHEIGAFLLKGVDAQAQAEAEQDGVKTAAVAGGQDSDNDSDNDRTSAKKRKRKSVDEPGSIARFFKTTPTTTNDNANDDNDTDGPGEKSDRAATPPHQAGMPSYMCPDCNKAIPEIEREEHQDWHFAKALQAQDAPSRPSQQQQPASPQIASHARPKGSSTTARSNKRGRGGRAKTEKGQSKLLFGQ